MEVAMNTENKSPEVDMPCTYCIGSDRYAGKVASVSASKKSITVKYGFSEREVPMRLYQDGKYRGRKGIGSVILGKSETRLDPSF